MPTHNKHSLLKAVVFGFLIGAIPATAILGAVVVGFESYKLGQASCALKQGR